MQNLKVFQAFVKKEFFHIFRDIRTMMIVLLMPIVQMPIIALIVALL